MYIVVFIRRWRSNGGFVEEGFVENVGKGLLSSWTKETNRGSEGTETKFGAKKKKVES